ncbi:DNA-directed RNA polymerase III subunit RPC3 isoform X1 [Hemiscyllium ocellatum]|nr:DNA-directed RNA polymerase III subunit RPC3 isoform X1 [Hemiscyllium ocellatum]XP_060676829.1 DNA-directed RNA polymerase III subunit RPC3 isoform X1 [Hemiscyllium ocellatum]
MTHFETQICSCLLQAHYGEIVAKVGTHLICTGCQPLRLIANDTETPIDQVKKALCVLIHHNFASYHVHKRGFVEYEVHCAHIIRILRYPRYIYSAKTLYGDTGELIVEELLQNGKMTMSTVVKKVADRLRETMEDNKTREHSETSNTFVRLVQTHFLQKCGLVSESVTAEGSQLSRAPTLITDEKEMYTVPNLSVGAQGKRRRMSEDGTEPKSKRSKPEHSDQELPPDDGIYWQVNFERFHQHFRDQAIVAAVNNKLDQTSSEIVRTMLRMSEVTTSSSSSHTQPLSSNEIFRAFPPGYNLSKPVLDQYLTLLSDDPMEFVGKSGDSGGGMFVINLHRALASLARATVESVVQERFGSRSARIFRLLLRKRHLEQKQVEDFAMIPAKEAKEMMYRMLSENYISLQEIPKTPDHAPSRTFYLYTVNLLPTARMILQRCYKTVVNLINRREYETRENKRLLEKSQRIEAIMASMQATGAEEQQLQEIEEMITAPEQQQLETLKHNVNMLDSSENQVDETIFILESYINTTRIEKEVPSKR